MHFAIFWKKEKRNKTLIVTKLSVKNCTLQKLKGSMIEMPEYFWQNKLYHERKMFHRRFLCRNASLVCSTVARQSLLIILTTVLQSTVTWAKPNPVHPFKKCRSEAWVWKGTVQVSSFSHKTRFVLSRNYLFLLVSIISYDWGLLIPCSAHFNGNSDTRHHILFHLEHNQGLLAEIWVWLERGKHHFKTWEEIGWALAKAGPASWNWGTSTQYQQK